MPVFRPMPRPRTRPGRLPSAPDGPTSAGRARTVGPGLVFSTRAEMVPASKPNPHRQTAKAASRKGPRHRPPGPPIREAGAHANGGKRWQQPPSHRRKRMQSVPQAAAAVTKRVFLGTPETVPRPGLPERPPIRQAAGWERSRTDLGERGASAGRAVVAEDVTRPRVENGPRRAGGVSPLFLGERGASAGLAPKRLEKGRARLDPARRPVRGGEETEEREAFGVGRGACREEAGAGRGGDRAFAPPNDGETGRFLVASMRQ
jgi:hypothetical protein